MTKNNKKNKNSFTISNFLDKTKTKTKSTTKTKTKTKTKSKSKSKSKTKSKSKKSNNNTLIIENNKKFLSILSSFYELKNVQSLYLIKYNDPTSKKLIRNALNNFKLCTHPQNTWTDIETNFKRIDLAYKVQLNLLDSLGLTPKTMPKAVKYATEDMTRGLSKFISNRYSAKLPHSTVSNGFIKLWECLSVFNLIPTAKTEKSFRVFHICEAPGQMILACKYFTEQKRKNITDYEWIANSLNPFNHENKMKYGKVVSDDYCLIRKNPKKWLWGCR
jgi:hypothetical protein